jgi:hypothetical protein
MNRILALALGLATFGISTQALAEECIDASVTEVTIRAADQLRLKMTYSSAEHWHIVRKSDWGNSEDALNRLQSLAVSAFLSGSTLYICHDETVVSGSNSSEGYVTRLYLKHTP